MNCKDITGKRFGKLTVIRRAGTNKNRAALWECVCDCGAYKTITGSALRTGHTQSCGCLQKKIAGNTIKSFNKTGLRSKGRYLHGENKTKLHNIWVNMRARCNNPKWDHYDRYGGRGISVCDEWNDSYISFRDWALSHGYEDGLEIDRIDNDGNYEPENCKWSNREEQVNNRSNTVFVTIDGVKKPLSVWCREKNVDYKTAHAKLKKGIPPIEIF